jgi:hypothetical protein
MSNSGFSSLHDMDRVELCIINHSIRIWPSALPPEHARPSEFSRQLTHLACAILHTGGVYIARQKIEFPDIFRRFAPIFSFGIAIA